MYKINIPEVNNLGKHLDKEKDQRDPVNRIILSILDKIASLVEPGQDITDKDLLDVATQSNHIRGKFLDLDKTHERGHSGLASGQSGLSETRGGADRIGRPTAGGAADGQPLFFAQTSGELDDLAGKQKVGVTPARG